MDIAKKLRGRTIPGFAFGLVLVAGQVGAQTVDAAIAEQAGTDKAAANSQAAIDRMQDEAQGMALKYADTLAQAESMKRYGDQLAIQIESQSERIEEMRKQLATIEVTQRDVFPLMEKMVATLEQFVVLDAPFLAEERANRVRNLKELLGRSDVSTSEKYRRILEAYQIETEYGRTLDAYAGKLGEGDASRTVQFVRLGRVALVYQTLDGEETGYWDAQKKSWVRDDSYARDVRKALSVAKKEGAPDLLMMPVAAPVEVQP